jgi:ribonuclease J
LRAFAKAIDPKVFVPIHGVSWDDGHAGFPPIRRLGDGEVMTL